MGALGPIVVTGAGGFLGRHVVAEATERGLEVRAQQRRGPPAEGVETQMLDLADPAQGAELKTALAGARAVIHCAGAVAGDDATHARDTLAATEALYEALPEGVPVILAGSMAVYAGRPGLIDERAAQEVAPERRDAYARAKLRQERIAADHAGRGADTLILRLGALWAPERMWNAHIGPQLGPVVLRMAGAGELPVVHVADAARALVMAAERPVPPGISVLNIVGDDRPDARAWLARMGPSERPRLSLPLPWWLLLPPAVVTDALGLPAPGLLRAATLRYRMAPRRYDNSAAKAHLGWQPEDGR